MNKKNKLLLLHGALGEQDMFTELKKRMSDSYEIHFLNFEGHGSRGPSEREFSIQNFSENVLLYMRENKIDQADIFGFSMGGYVALYIALVSPEKVRKISTLGTVLKWDPAIAEKEGRLLNPDKIEEKVPGFAKKLHQSHPHGWKKVVHKTRKLLADLGDQAPIKEQDWEIIKHPVRLHVGDRDQTAGLKSTTDVFEQLENGELCILPRTPHPLPKVNYNLLENSLREFFN